MFPEPARCLGATIDGPGIPPEHVDCRTASYAPNVGSIGLLDGQAKRPVTLHVEYETHGLTRHGSVDFDPMAAKIEQVKQILTMVPEWVVARDEGRPLLYFTPLVAYGYALSEIRYGFDDEPPGRHVRFTPKDEIGTSPGDELYIDLRAEVRSITVEPVFRDGTTMKRTFPGPGG